MITDPQEFLRKSTNTAGSSEYTLLPEGDYRAFIEDVRTPVQRAEQWVLPVVFTLMDEELQKAMNTDTVSKVRDYWLDLTADGALDFGSNKNVQLSALRAAVDQNNEGEAWSPSDLIGAGPVVVKVKHRAGKKLNEDGSATTYANIVRVVRAD